MGKTLLYLHRRDLRLHDNAVLNQLNTKTNDYSHFLALTVLPAHQMELSSLLKQEVTKNPEKAGESLGEFGAWRCGGYRIKFLCETLWDLKKSYADRGVDFQIHAGRAEKIVPQVVDQLRKADHDVELWYQEEYTTEEVREQNRLKKALPADLTIKVVEDNTLVGKTDLKFRIQELPNFYTEFRKRQEPLDYVRKPYSIPDKFPPAPETKLEIDSPYVVPDDKQAAIDILSKLIGGTAKISKDSAYPLLGGETNALKRLDFYTSGGKSAPAATYKQTRNGLVGHAFSTKFSAYLSLGSLSAKTIHDRLNAFEREHGLQGNPDTYWIRFELLWRDYFKFIALKFRHHLFTKEGLKQKPIDYDWKGPESEEYKRWREGNTGVGMVDAARREMNQTGYMSNRARQICASFLTKDLDVDWRIGAEFFEQQLIDHDPASNYGNWQYQAGVGNDPRGGRRFNPAKQAHDYDPKGEWIKLWVPELKNVHDRMGWTYMWTINDKNQEQLGLSDHPGCAKPIKGLCGGDQERHGPSKRGGGHHHGGGRGGKSNGHGGGGHGGGGGANGQSGDGGGYRGKARRGQGRPRRGEGGRLGQNGQSVPGLQ